MKTKTCFFAGIGVMAILLCGYAVLEGYENDVGSAVSEELNETVVCTSTPTEDTTTTTRPAAKGEKTYKTCKSYCKGIGYDSGECRLNGQECRVRMEVRSIYGGRLCMNRRLDTCCCKTDNSVDMESRYSYALLAEARELNAGEEPE